MIEEIRDTDNQSKRNKIKEELPVFFAGVILDKNINSFNKSDHVSSTGIIQFDVDEYDKQKSLELYPFYSKTRKFLN